MSEQMYEGLFWAFLLVGGACAYFAVCAWLADWMEGKCPWK